MKAQDPIDRPVPPEVMQEVALMFQNAVGADLQGLLQQMVDTFGHPLVEARKTCLENTAMLIMPLEINNCTYAVICKANPDGGWLINGLKPWPLNGPLGDLPFMVIETDGPGPDVAAIVNIGPADNPLLAVTLSLIQRD